MENSTTQTILNQLGGAENLKFMIGVKEFFVDGEKVSFKVPPKLTKSKIGYVRINLESNDTYTINAFQVIRSCELRLVGFYDFIMAEDLKTAFEKVTGLLLTVSPR